MGTVRTAAVTAAGVVSLAAVLCGPALSEAVSTSLTAYADDVPAAAAPGAVYGPFAAPSQAGAGVVAGADAVPVPADGTAAAPAAASPVAASFTASGIPARVLDAYRAAAASAAPGCRLDWTLLAAVGHVESGHARGGRLDAAGRTTTPIVGPALDGGPGVRAITDSDGGRLDGDTVWDRAVGPMQFIPGTWAGSGADGNGDGRADPHQIDDATHAAARYLCAGGADLSTAAGARSAVLRYNASDAYATRVLYLAGAYRDGVPVRAGYPAVAGPVAPVAGPVAPAAPLPLPVGPVAPVAPAPVPAPVAPVPAPVAPVPVPGPVVPGPVVPPVPTTAPGTTTPGTTTPGTTTPPTSAPGTTTPAPTTSAPAPTTSAPATTSRSTTSTAPTAPTAPTGSASTTGGATTSGTTTAGTTTAGTTTAGTTTAGATAADPTCVPGSPTTAPTATTCPTPAP